MIHRDTTDGIATIRLAHGKVSALDTELLEALGRELDVAAADARAIVLTGEGSAFSAGVDLFRILDGGDEYLDRFLPALDGTLRKLFGLPLPVVAAVNGHAIAGGGILALACDYKVMSAGRIGVPELLVGVPFPVAALEIVRFAVPRSVLQSVIYTGRTLAPGEAAALGLVDEAVDPGDLAERALAVAQRLAAIPRATFRLTKSHLRSEASERISRMDAAIDPEVRRIWRDPASHEAIRAWLDRTLKRT
jgi:enoyl-CoA hydratase